MGGAGSRSPGRPRQDGRAALTKADILAAAIPIFAISGYAGTSIRDICSAIGAHPSSVFHHFANKEELFSVCYDYVASPYIELYAEIEDMIKEPEKAMVVRFCGQSLTGDSPADSRLFFGRRPWESGLACRTRNGR